MNATQAFALGIGLVALMGAVAIFALAWRRERVAQAVGTLDREAQRADKAREKERLAQVEAQAAAVIVDERPADEGPPPPTEAEPAGREVIEVSEEEYGVTRRQFLNRGLLTAFGVYLAGFGITSLAFLWPRLSGGFGSKIDVGDAEDIREQLVDDTGRVEPLYIAEARSYIIPFPEGEVAGTDFEGVGVVAAGLSALFQTCVHLGCRVPFCNSSQGFECPCHGSRYNLHGEYEAGPAPRNMDRFAVEVNDQGRLIVDTGSRVDTPRSALKTVAYPRGVSCL